MKKFHFFFVFAALFFSSCSLDTYFSHRQAALESEKNMYLGSVQENASGAISSISWSENLPLDEAMIAPNIAIKNRIIDNIDTAKKSVYLTVYLLTDMDITESLIRAKKRGVEVKAILEKEVVWIPNANRKVRDMLASAGVEVVSKADDGFVFVHAKTLLTDDSYVISTGNYTKSSFSTNREWYLFGKDPGIREYLGKLFLGDFYGNRLTGVIPESLYVSPVNSRSTIEQALSQAKKRIVIYAQSLSDEAMIKILADRKLKGVDVRVCIAKLKKKDSARIKLEKTFSDAKIPFTETKGPILHAKTIVADDIFLVGSENFTRNSLDSNREVGRILPYHEYEKMYRDTMEQDCKWH